MRALLALAALALLAACGRVGDIRPPGPPEEVTWPRIYPSYPALPPAQGPAR